MTDIASATPGPAIRSIEEPSLDNERTANLVVKILYVDLLTDDDIVVQRAFQSLHNLVCCNSSNFDNGILLRLRGLNVIVGMITKWSDDEIIQGLGISIITHIILTTDAYKKYFKVLVDQFDYFDVLFGAMDDHITNSRVQTKSLQQLVHFATNSKDFHRYLLENSGHHHCILNTAKQFPDDIVIQTLACKFFYDIVQAQVYGLIPGFSYREIRTMIAQGLVRFHDENHHEYRCQAYATLQCFVE